jgi:cell division protein FtsL
MEESKKIHDLEQQIKKLLQRIVKLEQQNIEKGRSIRILKAKVSDLETNVEYLSRRKNG